MHPGRAVPFQPALTSTTTVFRTSLLLVLLQGGSAGLTTTRVSYNVTDGGTDAAGAAVAGEVLLFAGGKGGASELADVSVFTPGKGWSVMKGVLSGARAQMTSTALPDGSVAMFAGGEDANKVKFAGVDIYTASTGKWTAAKLSQPRSFPAAASVVVAGRTLSLFAGGECSEGRTGTDSRRVDIYEHGKGWVVNADLLSKPRKKLAAATAGPYILIGGGYTSGMKNTTARGYSDVVDLFHAGTGKWTTATLSQPRQYITAASAGSVAVFAGGFCSPYDSLHFPIAFPLISDAHEPLY